MTLQEATHLTQDRRVWRATIDERLTVATASPWPWRRTKHTFQTRQLNKHLQIRS